MIQKQMPKVGKPGCAIGALALALAVAGSLSTARATVTYTIGNGGLDPTTFNVTIDSTTINGALAGGISINQMGPIDPSLPDSYVTVCTDIQGTLYLGNPYTYDGPVAFAGQGGVNPTWGTGTAATEAAAIQNAAYLFYNYGNLTTAGIGGSPTQMAALQLAVWEVLYNTTGTGVGSINGTRFSVTGGADSTAISLAASWVTALDAMSNAGNFGYDGYLLYPDPATGDQNPTSQGKDGEPPQELLMAMPVPEAPTVIAGMLLVLPLAASAFKILRRKRNGLEVGN